LEDIEHDESVGFELISTDDIDDIGIPAIIAQIRQRVGTSPVYLRYCANPFSTLVQEFKDTWNVALI
jgi:Arginase family